MGGRRTPAESLALALKRVNLVAGHHPQRVGQHQHDDRDRRDQHGADERDAGSDPGYQPAREGRGDDHHRGQRQQPDSAGHGGHAVHVLQVEGDEEDAAHEH